MNQLRTHQEFRFESSVRHIQNATRRFAQRVTVSKSETLAMVLLGPAATPKADIAQRLHGMGPRSARPFVRIDCRHPAGIQFATLNGATRSTRPIAGADEPPRHFLHVANGGTIFFDHWSQETARQCAHLFEELRGCREAPLAAADPFCIDAAIIIAVDVKWIDGSDEDALLIHVPLPQLEQYIGHLAHDADAERLAAN